jgi:outer membrane murein-binding lipoprotein Lpp
MAISNKVGEEQRRQMVAEAAYFRAEKRGFGVDPVADWIEAEIEIDARVREIENAHLIEHLEEGLAAATQRVAALKKRLGKAAADVRTEWGADVEKLGKLRDALREKVKDLRTEGEQAGQRARQQAERIWDEINDTMRRVATRARH